VRAMQLYESGPPPALLCPFASVQELNCFGLYFGCHCSLTVLLGTGWLPLLLLPLGDTWVIGLSPDLPLSWPVWRLV